MCQRSQDLSCSFDPSAFRVPGKKSDVKAIEYHLVRFNFFYFGLTLNHYKCGCHFNSGPISSCESNANVSLVEMFSV